MELRRITEVRPLEGYSVHVHLTDGSERDIDLTRFLWGPVFAPITEDRSFFEQVFVDPVSRTVAWPNGADIDPDVLLGEAEPARTGASSRPASHS